MAIQKQYPDYVGLVNQAEVARRLGRSREWVRLQRERRNPRRDRSFPVPVKQGRSLLFSVAEIDEWIESHREKGGAYVSLEGHQGIGTVCDESLPDMPSWMVIDRATGLCTLHYSTDPHTDYWADMSSLESQLTGEPGGTPTSFYMHVTDSLIRRLTASQGCQHPGRGEVVTLIDRRWTDRIRLSTYGATERERIALRRRQPKFMTREALEEELCKGQEDTRGKYTAQNLLRHCKPLMEIAHLAQDLPGNAPGGPGQSIESALVELLGRTSGDWRTGTPPSNYRPVTIGEAIRKQRRRQGDPAENEAAESAADAARLRELLTTPWYLDQLTDVGVTVRVDGNDVHLSFVDPAEAHCERFAVRDQLELVDSDHRGF